MATNIGELGVKLTSDARQFYATMDKARREVNKTESSFSKLAVLAKRLGPAIAGTVTIGSIAAMSRAAHTLSGVIIDNARAVGMSTDAYQEWTQVMREIDVSQESFNTGILQLNEQIGKAAAGQTRAARGFEMLGISIKDANGDLKGTDTLLQEVLESARSVGSSNVAASFRMLFGGASFEIQKMTDLTTEQIQKMRDLAAVQSNEVLVATDVLGKRYDALVSTVGDKLLKAWQLVIVAAGKATGLIAPTMNEMKKRYGEVLEELNEANTKISSKTNPRVAAQVKERITALQEELKTLKESIGAQEEAARKQEELANAKAAQVEADRQSFLTSKERAKTEKEAADIAKRYADEQNNLADSVKRSVDPVYVYAQELQKLNLLLEEGRITQEHYNIALKEAGELRDAARIKANAEAEQEFTEMVEASETAVKEANLRYQEWIQSKKDSAQAIIESIDPQARYNKVLEEYNELRKLGALSEEQYILASKKAFEELEGAANTNKELNNTAKELGLTFTSAFEEAVIGGEKFRDVLEGIGQDIAKILLRKAITEPLANAIGSIDFGSFFGGSKAVGGPIDQGKVYKVHKDEYIIPRVPGTVVPVGGTGRASPNVRIEIVNQGQPVDAQVGASRQTPDSVIIPIVLKNLRKPHSPLRTAIRGIT